MKRSGGHKQVRWCRKSFDNCALKISHSFNQPIRFKQGWRQRQHMTSCRSALTAFLAAFRRRRSTTPTSAYSGGWRLITCTKVTSLHTKVKGIFCTMRGDTCRAWLAWCTVYAPRDREISVLLRVTLKTLLWVRHVRGEWDTPCVQCTCCNC